MSLDWLLKPQLLAYRDAGYEVIGMSAATGFVASLERDGIPHVEVENATRSFALRQDVAALVELHRLFRRLRPDIVHTHNPKPGVYGRAARRAAGVPLVVNTQHGLYATPDDRWARRAAVYTLERAAAFCSDVELIQNVEDRDQLSRLGVPDDKLIVVGNGVDLQRFVPDRAGRAGLRAELGIGEDDIVFGLVGRLVAEKGYRQVFAAAERLAVIAPDVRLLVIGPTDHDKGDAITPEEIAAAEEHGVRFLGTRDDVDLLYGAMDAYVLASHREGFPRSAMEAAASGLPIVATDVRGCRQVVDDGVTGLLVPIGDPGALAQAIASLAAAPDQRRAMGAAAVRKAGREFDQQQVIRTTLAAYERRPHRRTGARGAP